MKEIWQKNIDNLDDKKLFDYLTIERGNYQLKAIEYAENLLNEKKISLIHLQKKYNYNQKSIDLEITKRLSNEESLNEIKENFKQRNLSDFIYLIEEKDIFLKEKKSKKKRNSKITTNVLLSIFFSFLFISRKIENPNIIHFFISLIFLFTIPFVLSILIEAIKSRGHKNQKFEFFPKLFYNLWLYLILFFLASLLISIST
jgi:hypothetical protein